MMFLDFMSEFKIQGSRFKVVFTVSFPIRVHIMTAYKGKTSTINHKTSVPRALVYVLTAQTFPNIKPQTCSSELHEDMAGLEKNVHL